MLGQWLGQALPLPDLCGHQLVEGWAAKTPGKVAVITSATGASITYGELNAKANQLARKLQVGRARREAAEKLPPTPLR